MKTNEHPRHIIVVRDNYFTPAALTIQYGDTVEWVNLGSVPHTAASGSGCQVDSLWTTQRMQSGESYWVVVGPDAVDTVGTFGFHCPDHCVGWNMRGLITVKR